MREASKTQRPPERAHAKKTKDLCGIFDALCYIPALLTNQN